MKDLFLKLNAISLSALFVTAFSVAPMAHATTWRDWLPETTNFYIFSDRGGDWSFRKMGHLGDGNPSREGVSERNSTRSEFASTHLELIDSIGEDLFIMPKVFDW